MEQGQWLLGEGLNTSTHEKSVVSLLILQSTPFCNIDCKYCYLSDRSLRHRMRLDVVSSAIERLVEADLIGDRIGVCWHAGEPLSVPIDYYLSAVALIRRLLPSSCNPEFGFQTNGTLISEAWCRYFLDTNARIGVSIDGPAVLHDRERTTRSGTGTHARTLRGIRLLRQFNVPFHVICVLTRESMRHAREIFDFFCAEGISHVCFNIEESEGTHQSELIKAGSAPAQFRNFFREYVSLVKGAGQPHWVREIDAPFRVLFNNAREQSTNQQTSPFSIITIDWQGNLSTFSPELIGTASKEHANFKYGNVLYDSIASMRGSPAFQRTLREIRDGVEACRSSCAYFPVCGGGAPSNKYFETKSLSSTRTVYCEAMIKATADVVLEAVVGSTSAPVDASPTRHA